MRKQIFSVFASLLYVLALLVAFTGPVSAHTAALKPSFDIPGCQKLELTLHGHATPTSRCLTNSSKGVQPLGIVPCGNDGRVLTLYWNSMGLYNVPRAGHVPSGPIMCIRGRGWVDLSGMAWNDQASAYWAGCSSGHFDTDAGLFPGRQQFFGGVNGTSAPGDNFDGLGNHLTNDSLTVITLDSDC